jgi:hypothetical protein
MTSQHAMSTLPLAAPDFANAHAQLAVQIAFLPTLSKQRQIAFALHINRCVAPAFPHYSKQSSMGT